MRWAHDLMQGVVLVGAPGLIEREASLVQSPAGTIGHRLRRVSHWGHRLAKRCVRSVSSGIEGASVRWFIHRWHRQGTRPTTHAARATTRSDVSPTSGPAARLET